LAEHDQAEADQTAGVIATDTSNFSKEPGDGSVTSQPPFVLPGPPTRIALICLAFGAFILVLLEVGASLVTRSGTGTS